MKNIIVTSLFALTTTVAFSAHAAEEEKGQRGKPPTEAFEACASLSENASCSVSTQRGDITGTCKAPPRGEGDLACVPERGERGGQGERPSRG